VNCWIRGQARMASPGIYLGGYRKLKGKNDIREQKPVSHLIHDYPPHDFHWFRVSVGGNYDPHLKCAGGWVVVGSLVDLVGIEPTTSSMPWKRAPSCATGPLGAEGNCYLSILA
jgi:hypothetical protein